MPDGYVVATATTPNSNDVGTVVRQVGEVSAVAGAESLANPTAFQRLSHGLLWNQTTWDRAQGNVDGTAIANATRTTATIDSADLINYNHRGVHVVLNYSTGQATIITKIQGKDVLSGNYYTLATTASISASSTTAYILYPGISAGAGSFNTVLPRTWRVETVAAGSLTANYGVGYSLIK